MKIHVIYNFPLVLNITDVIKICNCLSHYFSKKTKEKFESQTKKLFLNEVFYGPYFPAFGLKTERYFWTLFTQ